ncbi:hypothetical protein HDV03_001847 [Kappamyces sp. JEL0829]|nr:hypothetical protein HDV03_001847 [Kappamyces sp. JEL0829]
MEDWGDVEVPNTLHASSFSNLKLDGLGGADMEEKADDGLVLNHDTLFLNPLCAGLLVNSTRRVSPEAMEDELDAISDFDNDDIDLTLVEKRVSLLSQVVERDGTRIDDLDGIDLSDLDPSPVEPVIKPSTKAKPRLITPSMMMSLQYQAPTADEPTPLAASTPGTRPAPTSLSRQSSREDMVAPVARTQPVRRPSSIRSLSRQSSADDLPPSGSRPMSRQNSKELARDETRKPPMQFGKPMASAATPAARAFVRRPPSKAPTPTPSSLPHRFSSGSSRDMKRPPTHMVAFGRTLRVESAIQPVVKPKPRQKPTLIRNLASSDSPKVVGNMVYDPVLKVWTGNESALKAFDKVSSKPALKPTLITPQQTPQALSNNGMVFDPVACVWKGNDEECHIFDEIDSFEVSTDTKMGLVCNKECRDAWTKSETTHKLFMGTWYPKANDSRFTYRESKAHLYSIRDLV